VKSKKIMLEKLEAFKRVQDCTVDIKGKLEETVKSTYGFNVKGNFIKVYYGQH